MKDAVDPLHEVAAHADAEAPVEEPQIWKTAAERGGSGLISTIGTGAVAFLAGFNLFTLVTVIGWIRPPLQRPADWSPSPYLQAAVALHALAVGILMLTMLTTLTAQMYDATPDRRLSLRPEATVSVAILQRERERQYLDYYLWLAYMSRATKGLIAGLTATLAGVMCIGLADTPKWLGLTVLVTISIAILGVWAWQAQWPPRLYPNERPEHERIIFRSFRGRKKPYSLREPSAEILRSVMQAEVKPEITVDDLIDMVRKLGLREPDKGQRPEDSPD